MPADAVRRLLERGRRIFRYISLRLVRVGGDPSHVALGFALGVFLGVFPTFGLGIPIALLLASILRWNRAAALLGSLVMNPLTTPFFWSLSTTVGAALFRIDAKDLMNHARNGEKLRSVKEGALAYLAGTTVVALLAAVVAYFVALRTVRLYREKKHKRRERRRTLR